ncbi:MAG: redoxin domain-containing protein [Odoribacter sp.]|nr:redoxin domain-containing protein [Bacteroidales bacterium]MBR2981484.1 redoxin domain-containing protein [Odoribacter sp.]
MRQFWVLALVAMFAIACKGKSTNAVQGEASPTEVQTVQTEQKVYENDYIVQVGDMAPDFELTMDDGSTFKLSDHRGKLVMLQFTASWCGICRQEMPHIEKDIWQRHKDDKDFVLVGVCRRDSLAQAKQLAEGTGVTYHMVLDTDSEAFTKYATAKAGVTRNVLVSPEGKIIMLTRLFKQDEFNQLVKTIDSLLLD